MNAAFRVYSALLEMVRVAIDVCLGREEIRRNVNLSTKCLKIIIEMTKIRFQ